MNVGPFAVTFRLPLVVYRRPEKEWSCITVGCPERFTPVRLSSTGRCSWCGGSLYRGHRAEGLRAVQ